MDVDFDRILDPESDEILSLSVLETRRVGFRELEHSILGHLIGQRRRRNLERVWRAHLHSLTMLTRMRRISPC